METGIRGFRRFLMNGNRKVLTELCLPALSQNLAKYIRKSNSGKCRTHLLRPTAR